MTKRTQSGFTLLEVLVATTIMAVAIGGLLSSLTTSMKNASRLNEYDRAVLLAQHKMDDLLADELFPRGRVVEGNWPLEQTGGVTMGWRARLTGFDLPPAPQPGVPVVDRLELTVWWQQNGQEKTFPLEGFRSHNVRPEELQPGTLR